MSNRGATIEELDSIQTVPVKTSVGMSKNDSSDPLGRFGWLSVHPVQQLQTGRFSSVGCHRGRFVGPSRNGNVIKPTRYPGCHPFFLPPSPVLGKGIEIPFPLNDIPVQKQSVFDPHAIKITLKTTPVSGPLNQRIGKRTMSIMIAVQIDKVFFRKAFIPLVQPIQRLTDGRCFVFEPAPAKVKQITSPNADLSLINTRFNQALMFGDAAAITE